MGKTGVPKRSTPRNRGVNGGTEKGPILPVLTPSQPTLPSSKELALYRRSGPTTVSSPTVELQEVMIVPLLENSSPVRT